MWGQGLGPGNSLLHGGPWVQRHLDKARGGISMGEGKVMRPIPDTRARESGVHLSVLASRTSC
jgi:hypothetical protein